MSHDSVRGRSIETWNQETAPFLMTLGILLTIPRPPPVVQTACAASTTPVRHAIRTLFSKASCTTHY
ncbi:hypothetical protein LB505_005579 [Fusarium chuoi]|nr:hypothetical protein LB505_005579 [Fusarium chuoi]